MTAPLLAKSWPSEKGDPPHAVTLVGHTACVLTSIAALFGRTGSPKQLAESWMRFFGLAGTDFARFLRHLRVAAAAHDWGKANNAFQGAVKEREEQVIRHEHLSGLLLADLIAKQDVQDWLQVAGIDELVLIAAVISHHLKVGTEGEHTLGARLGERSTLVLLRGHDDFATIWKMIQDEVGSPCPIELQFPGPWDWKHDIQPKSRAMMKRLHRYASELNEERKRWVGSIRAALIVADALGSAVVRMEKSADKSFEVVIDRWAQDCFSKILTGDEIWTEVTKKRIADLRDRDRWNDSTGVAFGDERGFSQFQVEIAGQGPRVLLTAPCGSGKTLAAWNWIKTNLDQADQAPKSRVLFLYPTRATATEGFRDYVSWAPECDATLLSGTADYELQGMFETPDDPRDSRDPRRSRDYQRSDPRLYALGHWKKRIFSATADQFFPFMQYQYGPICMLPLLAESVLVVDEVHSFDESMFSTLRRFLREFPTVPVLCMTATLPVERRNALIGCGLKPYPETPPADTADDSSYERCHVEWICREKAHSLVTKELSDHRRVLWVSNRVSDCQDVHRRHCEDDDITDTNIKTFCYHGRFKLEHRHDRHRKLIAAFKDSVEKKGLPEGLLGATTQVCEMSLDLDAEILVTELAPIASLIQRMGRCNRDSKKMRERPIGRVYVLEPEDGKEKPYEKKDLDAARRFVDQIAGKDVSQDTLETTYRDCDPSKIEPLRVCAFLDSGPYAEAGQETFRDSDEFTVPCILDDDRNKVLDAIAARRPIDGYIVPVPRRHAQRQGSDTSRLPRWVSIAEGRRYCALTGFDDRIQSGSNGGSDS